VSLAEILDNVIELQSRRLQLNGITVQKQYRCDGVIQGFPVELKQVFLNIISNAVQAMPSGGRLRVRLCRSAELSKGRQGVRVSIFDTGLGIRPEHAKKIFEPFFSTKEAKGTGLGLWISKGIIQKYEGSIRFRSLRLSDCYRTCFSVFIPSVAAPRSTETAAELVA
jgi:signal transduction histidine kinase